jgi:hypothetical protein
MFVFGTLLFGTAHMTVYDFLNVPVEEFNNSPSITEKIEYKPNSNPYLDKKYHLGINYVFI